jgi:hypothetical protein
MTAMKDDDSTRYTKLRMGFLRKSPNTSGTGAAAGVLLEAEARRPGELGR